MSVLFILLVLLCTVFFMQAQTSEMFTFYVSFSFMQDILIKCNESVHTYDVMFDSLTCRWSIVCSMSCTCRLYVF